MGTVFYTDLGSDLPLSYANERNLTILPLTYKIGDREITAMEDPSMPIQKFYEKLREGESSTTAQINTFAFMEEFRPVLERGDDVFYIPLSSGISGTCQSAMLVRDQLLSEFPDRKVFVVDSKLASLGQGLFVHYALNMRDEGKSLEEIERWLESNRYKFCSWFTVDDLNFLRRGGRVTAAAAFLGTMLSIKPVLHVNDEGRLVAIEKVKGRARSLRTLVDHMERTAIDPGNQTVFISHGDSERDVNAVADMIRSRFGTKDIFTSFIGPVIGTHSGPDTIALFFMGSGRL